MTHTIGACLFSLTLMGVSLLLGDINMIVFWGFLLVCNTIILVGKHPK